ncbi:MAG: hypothetical protein HYW24_03605 [Candidatus Aenigmarchaeota archaeon]|nr:hypothetical protein [Candidatus Aenigmarchaeota archaeon]
MVTGVRQETHGYEGLPQIVEAVNMAYEVGLINYHGGYKQTQLGRQSSGPEDMLEVALVFSADTNLIKRIRALSAAERIGLDPSRVQSTIVLYGLCAEERTYVSGILKRHQERFDGPEKPNRGTVREILGLLSSSLETV